jgi:hypothetical protein
MTFKLNFTKRSLGAPTMHTVFAYVTAAFLCAVSFAAAADDVTLPGLEDEHAGLTKEQVLKSQEWRKSMLNLSTWFDTQKMYNKEQVLDLKRKINAQVREMTPSQLVRYQQELDEKLAILQGPEARQIKLWLREQLALASEDYARRIVAALPDISKMSPDELQDYLNQFVAKVTAERRGAQELSKARTQQAQMVTSELNRQRQEADRAIDSAIRSGAASNASSGVIGAKNITGGEAPWGLGYGGGYGGYGYGGFGGWGYRW